MLHNNDGNFLDSNLTISKNHFPIPENIYKQDIQSIINYILNLHRSDYGYLKEAKITILGEADAGKTALVEQLKYGTFMQFGDTLMTKGISIDEFDIISDKSAKTLVRTWDFGGQEVMHAMHQFFMTERSLYLLVWNARLDDPHGRIEDWIRLIKAFGGKSPILLVINKTDDGNFMPNIEHLLSKYSSNLKAVVRTSCKESINGSHGITELKDLIKKEIAGFKHLEERIPKSWLLIKEAVKSQTEKYISLSEYYNVCRSNNEHIEERQNILLRLLHDLGIAINYGDISNPDSTNILNPEWVTKGIYSIINSNKLFQSFGRVSLADLVDIMTPINLYPLEKHQVILSLMEKFELCFKIKSDEYLIPDLLLK